MAKQYPPFQSEDARTYIEKLKEWVDVMHVGLNRLVDDHSKIVRMDQFSGTSLRILLFHLGGDVTVPKEVMEKYEESLDGDGVNIKASPQEDGSWRIWTVLEKDDPLPEDEQSKS